MEPALLSCTTNADASKVMDAGFDGDDDSVIDWFESLAEKAGEVQTETLCRILRLNYGVEYLKKWLGDIDVEDLDGCALEALYTCLVPLASHADLESYIHRIADGDKSPLLTQQPITTLSLRYYINRSVVCNIKNIYYLHSYFTGSHKYLMLKFEIIFINLYELIYT